MRPKLRRARHPPPLGQLRLSGALRHWRAAAGVPAVAGLAVARWPVARVAGCHQLMCNPPAMQAEESDNHGARAAQNHISGPAREVGEERNRRYHDRRLQAQLRRGVVTKKRGLVDVGVSVVLERKIAQERRGRRYPA
jgi:hypothetical protein